MKDRRIALRYARALFELAQGRGELGEIEKGFAEAHELVRRHPEISHLILNATISREEKGDFIEKILPKGTAPLLVNFLKVLIKKRRFQELPLIQERFHRLYEKKAGLQRVRVESPIPLDEILQGKLRSMLEKKLKRTVYLELQIHPELLGGLVLDFDGTQIDGSFKTALHELKQRLLAPYAEAGRSH